MAEYIDGQLIFDLCKSWGYNPYDVTEIVIEPGSVTVTRFLRGENGDKVTGGEETVRYPILWPIKGRA